MAQVLSLRNGNTVTVSGIQDIIILVDELIGTDARYYLEDFLAEPDDEVEYTKHLEKENQELRDHHRKVMEELRKLSETEAGLIREKEIDRKALSTVAGKIGRITWREVNVR